MALVCHYVLPLSTLSYLLILYVDGAALRDDSSTRKDCHVQEIDKNGYLHAISYATQFLWLRHQSIENNILFGYPFDEEWCSAIMECCTLMPALELLEYSYDKDWDQGCQCVGRSED